MTCSFYARSRPSHSGNQMISMATVMRMILGREGRTTVQEKVSDRDPERKLANAMLGIKYQKVFRLKQLDAINVLSSSAESEYDVRLTVPLIANAQPFITFHCAPDLAKEYMEKTEMIMELTQ